LNKIKCSILRLQKKCVKCPAYINWIRGKGEKCSKMIITKDMLLSEQNRILTFKSEKEAKDYAKKHLKKKTKIFQIT